MLIIQNVLNCSSSPIFFNDYMNYNDGGGGRKVENKNVTWKQSIG